MNSEMVRAWIDEAIDSLALDETPTLPEGVEGLSAAGCDELLSRLSTWASAVRFLQDGARRRLGEHLGTRGWVRFGERTYRAGPDERETLRPDRISEFYRLVETADLVAQVFPHYAARKGGLRALAEGWVDRKTGEVGSWRGFRDAFYEVEDRGIRVSELPVSKAPKFIQASEDGAVQYRGNPE